ncbi:hypothetical protein BDU57DRAFT_80653 [Ampelomyces quisqualis]|uniref:Uncharacterized protein n=1 Tax=Ampelomyces quisqualis TaxID=50730 RepID=A0A6A5QCF1_AMPQU|nr:hypothetical protein BDU57DRAFT_80653 [Ampelomyces quisqualis]
MRYSSAVVLSTLTVGHAAAAHSHNRHVGFHARREAAKRDEPVDYSKLSYDLSNVNWDEVNKEVNWSSVFASPVATPTPAASDKKPAPDVAPTAAAPTSKPAETPNAAKPAPAVPNNPGGEVVENTFVGVASIANKIGAKVGKNEKSDNGGIWVGGDGPWGMDVTNSGTTDSVFFCWKANGFSGMSINTNVPEISVGMKPGQSVQLSFAPNVPAACAPASASNQLAFFGGVDDTWAEVTFGQNGAFDVSRNVNMNGSNISMKGSQCTSDMNTCVFKCQDPNAKSCEKGYDLLNCHAGNGGGGGYDVKMAGVGGGCTMASTGERIQVTFS